MKSELFAPISDYESSQLVGGQFTIVLKEVGEIPPPETSTQRVAPNPTAIQIKNGTDLLLSYGYIGDAFEDVELAAGQTKDHFTRTELASAGWDKDLRQSDIQLDLALLKPGYLYQFERV